MRRTFLHAGQTKTGTTAVQNFLGKHREELLRLGYLVPKEGLSHIYNHAPLVSSILGEPTSPRHRDAAEALKKAIKDNINANVIISAERLFRYFQICGNRQIKNPRLISFLLEAGTPVTIIAYVRPRAEWVNSRYAQGVKSFLIDVSFQDYVQEELRDRSVRIAHVPDVARPPEVDTIFRPFNDEVRRTGVVRDFLSLIGLASEHR